MSGTTCTWAHHAVREGHRDQAIQALWITVVIRCISFQLMQGVEYYEAATLFILVSLTVFIHQHFIWLLDFMDFMSLLGQFF